MNKRIAHVLGAGVLAAVAGMVGGLGGCEEKKPETMPSAPIAAPSGGSSKPDASSVIDAAKDAGKQAVDTAKDAGKQAVDTAKDTASKGVEAAKSAAATLTDEVKKTANDYLSSLGNLGDTLEKIKSPLDAAGKAGTIKTETGALSAAYATLEKYSADTQAAIRSTFKDQLDTLTKKVNDQIARISADKSLGSSLGELLKGIKLF